ncbi:MAG: IclR family transcriptional regulator [Ectothiorhodospiraceae bacterium]|nr:IclR family transcriptional regulator [Ectothiorhodospiraceae bacterium]MCH8505926.1 IclR family transcriptional regulator [Ectothiorhodospiraceae bacterium]
MEQGVSGRQRRRDVDGNGNVVIALARGLELLRAFGPGDDYLGNAELARRTGIPRPTVSRLTATLTTLGYLRYSERMEKYQLGPGVLALGFRYLVSMNIRDIARPFMQELADSTDCMVALGTEDKEYITYIETCQGNGPLVVRMEVGSRIPVATSAIGRAYVAGLNDQQRERYLAQLRTHYTAGQWPGIERLLKLGCEQYRQYGFCMSLGEWEPDVHGVGVPLILKGQDEVLALNCGGVAHRLTRDVIENRLGPRLADMAKRIAEQAGGLGYA